MKKKNQSSQSITKNDLTELANDLKQIFQTETQALRTETQTLEIRLGEKLHETETRLNKRITDVGDLITITFGRKLKNHEKRITILEQRQTAA